MPHAARKKSESGYYHVVPKGESNRLLFEDDGDREEYLSLLGQAKEEAGLRLHAYALMSNHVHLVVEDEHGRLSDAMKFLHERYAAYFKEKAGRAGRIFRKPLWSEPIESDEYLLRAVRYVHANPAVAGICPASAYEWSSAKDYLGRVGIADTDAVLDMLGGRDGFVEFSRQERMPVQAFPGSRLTGHISDEDAFRVAQAVLGVEGLEQIGEMPQETRRQAIRKLLVAGIGQRQIARLTGMTLSAVHRVEQETRGSTPCVSGPA